LDAATSSSDRIVWWPLAVTAGVPLALVACDASPLGPDLFYVLLGIPALLGLWALAALLAMFGMIGSSRAHARRRALSFAILPAIVLANALAPFVFIRLYNLAGDTIHFEVMREHYQHVVDALPKTGQPKLVVFDWGGMVWASQGIVYDESDEVALPSAKQSPDWRGRASETDLVCGYSATPMGDHFYLADFAC
jgi:hypothetical protein